jgi:hypothetical protein
LGDVDKNLKFGGKIIVFVNQKNLFLISNTNIEIMTPEKRTKSCSSYQTPEKRSLGRIALYPSAYQCGWLGRDHLVYATIAPDSTTLHTDEGDTFESVGHWVQAEQRRELMRLQMENILDQREEDVCPDTPALFRSENNELPTVDENEPSLMTDLTELMNSVDSLEIEINEEDRDIYDDDDIDNEGFDLDQEDSTDQMEDGDILRASLGKRWKHINVEEETEEDNGVSPRSVTNVSGGERIMNFDIVKEVEELETIDTKSATSVAVAKFIRGKGKELLQQSLSNTGTVPSSISTEAAPMVIAGNVNITPLDVTHKDDISENFENDENDENNVYDVNDAGDDAVAAALEVFKSILNNSEFRTDIISSPKKSAVNNLVSNRTSPILVGGRY